MRSRLRLGRRACYLEWMSHVCACRRLAKSRREAVHVVLVAGTISRVSHRRCTIPLKNFEFYTSQTRHMSAILHVHTPHLVHGTLQKRFVNEKNTRARTLAARPPATAPPTAHAVELGRLAVPAAREQREQRARRSAQAQAAGWVGVPRGEACAAAALRRRALAVRARCGGVRAGSAPPARALQPCAAAPPAAAAHREGSHGVPGGARTVACRRSKSRRRASRRRPSRRRPSRRCPSRRRSSTTVKK